MGYQSYSVSLVLFLVILLGNVLGESEGDYTTDRIGTGLNETCTNYLRGSWNGTHTSIIVDDLSVGEAYVYMEDVNDSYFNNSISNVHAVFSNVYIRRGNYTDDSYVFLYGPGEYYPKTGRYMLELSTNNSFDINTVYGFVDSGEEEEEGESSTTEYEQVWDNNDNGELEGKKLVPGSKTIKDNIKDKNSKKIVKKDNGKNQQNYISTIHKFVSHMGEKLFKNKEEMRKKRINDFVESIGLGMNLKISEKKGNRINVKDKTGFIRTLDNGSSEVNSIAYYGLDETAEWPPTNLINLNLNPKTDDVGACSFVFYGQLYNYTTPTIHNLPDYYPDGDSYSSERITYVDGNNKLMIVPSSKGTLVSNDCAFLVDIAVHKSNSTPDVEEGYLVLSITFILAIAYTYLNFCHYKLMIENMVYVRQVSTVYSVLNSLITGIIAVTVLTNTYFLSNTFYASIPLFILLAGNLAVAEIQCVLIGMRRHHVNRCAMVFAVVGYLLLLIVILVLQYYLPMYVIDSILSALLLSSYIAQIIHNAINKFKTPFSIPYLIISPSTRILYYVYSAFFVNYLNFTPYQICGIILLICAYFPIIFLIIQKFSAVLTKEGLKEDERKIPAGLIIRLLGEYMDDEANRNPQHAGRIKDNNDDNDGASDVDKSSNSSAKFGAEGKARRLGDDSELFNSIEAGPYSSSSTVETNRPGKDIKASEKHKASENSGKNDGEGSKSGPNDGKKDELRSTDDSSILSIYKNPTNSNIVDMVKKNLKNLDQVVLYLPVEQDVRDDVIVHYCVNKEHFHNHAHANPANSKCIIPLTLRQAREMTTCSICLENINMLLIQGKYLTSSVSKKSIDHMEKIRHKLIKVETKAEKEKDSSDNDEDDSNNNNEASRDVTVTVCSHIFHTECLDNWMKIKIECPICKHKL